jgi:phosphoesterase RecJ-like protein
MSYRIPKSRLGAVGEVLELLKGAERVLLTTHINADGDGAGSEVALAGWLRALGKESWIINPTPYPDSLGFLLPERGWVLDSGSSKARDLAKSADLAVILDTGEVSRIGSVMSLVHDLPKVIIDHHPPGRDSIPGVPFRVPDACATGELVFDVLTLAGGPWPREAVRGLYVALLADTGSFRFSNTSPDTHRIAAFLMDHGADPEELHRSVYGNVPLRKLRLLQAALGKLELDPEGDLAWMTVPPESFEDLGATSEDIEGLVDYPRDIRGVEVGLLFRETARGATKVSFRSNGDTDVNALARKFGGGGHVKASGALVERPLAEVRPEVLEAVRNAIRGRKRDAGE